MKRYEFTVSLVVEGVKYNAGDQADEKDIPAGCLTSLLRLEQVRPVEPKPAPPPAKK